MNMRKLIVVVMMLGTTEVWADALPSPAMSYSFNGAVTMNAESTSSAAITWQSTPAATSYVSAPNTKALLLLSYIYSNAASNSGPDFTTSAWTALLYARVPATANQIVVSYGNRTVVNSLGLVSTGINGVKVVRISSPGKYSDLGVSATVKNAPAEWHSYALVYSGGQLALFVDGVAAGSAAYTPQTSQKNIQFGSFFGMVPSGLANATIGAIDEFRSYSSALTAEQLTALHAEMSAPVKVNGAAPYYSVSFNGNANSNPEASASLSWKLASYFATSPNGQAVNIGRTHAYTSSSLVAATTGDWTLSFVGIPPNIANEVFLNYGRVTLLNSIIFRSAGSEQLTLSRMSASDSKSMADLVTPIAVADSLSNWHTYTLTYRVVDSRLVLYVDDAFAGAADEFTSPVFASNCGIQLGDLFAGRGSTGLATSTSGFIDEMRFYTNALSSAQVATLHESFSHEMSGYSATLSGSVNWSEIMWDGGKTWANSDVEDVTLTLSADTTLTIDEAVELHVLKVIGPGTLTVVGSSTLKPFAIVCAPAATFSCPVTFRGTYYVDFDSPVTFANATSLYPDDTVVNSTKAATRTLYGTHTWTGIWYIPVCTSLDYGVVVASGTTVNAQNTIFTQVGNNRCAFRIKEGGTLNASSSVSMRTNTGYGVFEVSGAMNVAAGYYLYLENGGGCGFGSVDGSRTLNPTGLLTVPAVRHKTGTSTTLAVNTVLTGSSGTGLEILKYSSSDSTSSDMFFADGLTITANADVRFFYGNNSRWFRPCGEVVLDTNGHTISFDAFMAFAVGDTTKTRGRIVKKGAGTLKMNFAGLSAGNDYPGGTDVQGGTFFVAKTGCAGSGAIGVADGAEIALASGVTITNAVTLASGATFAVSNVLSRTDAVLRAGALVANGPAQVVVEGVLPTDCVSTNVTLAASCDAATFSNLTLDATRVVLANGKAARASLKHTNGRLVLRCAQPNGLMILVR